MFSLNSRIVVYETDEQLLPTSTSYEFPYCKHVAICSSYKNLTDTATLQLPKKLNLNWLSQQLGFQVPVNLPNIEERSIHEFFKLDNYIEIFLGYDGDYKPAFRGYITEVKGDAPVTIECQDLMYACKKQKIVASKEPADNELRNLISKNPSITVPNNIGDFIQERLQALEVPFETVVEIEDVGELIVMREWTVCQFLEYLREKHQIWSYFELGDHNNVLRITNNPTKFTKNELGKVVEKLKIDYDIPLLGNLGELVSSTITKLASELTAFLPSIFFGNRPTFKFFENIISDNLKVVKEEVKNIRFRVEKFLVNSNTPIYYELGNPEGELQKTFILHDNEDTLPKDELLLKQKVTEVQEDLRDYLAPRVAWKRRTGLSGSFTTFGEPFVRPTDSVTLTNAEDKEKNGTFIAETVKRTFGTEGYRQTITLGRIVETN